MISFAHKHGLKHDKIEYFITMFENKFTKKS